MLSGTTPIGQLSSTVPTEVSVGDFRHKLVLVFHDLCEHGTDSFLEEPDIRRLQAFLRGNDPEANYYAYPLIASSSDGEGDEQVEFFLERRDNGYRFSWYHDQAWLTTDDVASWLALIDRYLAHAVSYREQIEAQRIGELIAELEAQIRDCQYRIANLIPRRIQVSAQEVRDVSIV